MKPYIHAQNSAVKHGGKAEDYLPIHEFMDSSKAHIGDVRHRALFHSTFGCFIVEKVFGSVAGNSDGGTYFPRDIAEQHCLEDLGFIPTIDKWFESFKVEPWMGGNAKQIQDNAKSYAEKLIEKRHALKKELELNLFRVFTETFYGFEDDNYDLLALTFKSYTPYFNDGDVCEYSITDFEFIVAQKTPFYAKEDLARMVRAKVIEELGDDYVDNLQEYEPHTFNVEENGLPFIRTETVHWQHPIRQKLRDHFANFLTLLYDTNGDSDVFPNYHTFAFWIDQPQLHIEECEAPY